MDLFWNFLGKDNTRRRGMRMKTGGVREKTEAGCKGRMGAGD